MLLSPGDVISGITVPRRLGEGGLRAVNLERHPWMPRDVAQKVLLTEVGPYQDLIRTFAREIDAVAELSTPTAIAPPAVVMAVPHGHRGWQ
jgi:serine/threonine protein kinase